MALRCSSKHHGCPTSQKRLSKFETHRSAPHKSFFYKPFNYIYLRTVSKKLYRDLIRDDIPTDQGTTVMPFFPNTQIIFSYPFLLPQKHTYRDLLAPKHLFPIREFSMLFNENPNKDFFDLFFLLNTFWHESCN